MKAAVVTDPDDEDDEEQIPIAGRKTMPKTSNSNKADAKSADSKSKSKPSKDEKINKPKYPMTSGGDAGDDSDSPLIAVAASSSDPAEIAAREELQSILKKAPMIIFSKSYCPYSRRAKEILLHDYDIVPKPYVPPSSSPPTMGKKIQDLLKTLTGRATVPNIMIASQSLGGSDEIVELHNQGLLAERIRTMAGKRIVSVEPIGAADGKKATNSAAGAAASADKQKAKGDYRETKKRKL
ncbi:hypothetical protein DV735_g3394, partial [Chaetothyriales sp. CBS 134920]